jgi:demethylmenaquinone methyltransferase / 2-methoxy-6-polyprenyl-1,4-benzoquinol methylase
MRDYRLHPNSIRDLFDSVASRYDLLNHLLSLRRDVYWRRRAVQELKGIEGTILDIATGTGDVAIEIIRQGAGTRQVFGLDFSKPMLQKAYEKIFRKNLLSVISLSLGDALSLPFPDRSFDASMIAFGLRNIPDKDHALSEMVRVTKSKGKVVVLEFTLPQRGPMKKLYPLYFIKVLPRVGGFLSGDKGAYAYLPRSVFHFPSADNYKQIMRSAGLSAVDSYGLTFGIASIMTGTKENR